MIDSGWKSPTSSNQKRCITFFLIGEVYSVDAKGRVVTEMSLGSTGAIYNKLTPFTPITPLPICHLDLESSSLPWLTGLLYRHSGNCKNFPDKG